MTVRVFPATPYLCARARPARTNRRKNRRHDPCRAHPRGMVARDARRIRRRQQFLRAPPRAPTLQTHAHHHAQARRRAKPRSRHPPPRRASRLHPKKEQARPRQKVTQRPPRQPRGKCCYKERDTAPLACGLAPSAEGANESRAPSESGRESCASPRHRLESLCHFFRPCSAK